MWVTKVNLVSSRAVKPKCKGQNIEEMNQIKNLKSKTTSSEEVHSVKVP